MDGAWIHKQQQQPDTRTVGTAKKMEKSFAKFPSSPSHSLSGGCSRIGSLRNSSVLVLVCGGTEAWEKGERKLFS